jgi:rubrerythrin
MDPVHETAFETAIAIETRCLSYYRSIAGKVNDIKTRKLFDQLAKDESVHLAAFCNLFQGNMDELSKIIGQNIFSDAYYLALINRLDGFSIDINALRVALREEQICIDCYGVLANHIWEPRTRDVFVRTLDESNKHYAMISAQYLFLRETT